MIKQITDAYVRLYTDSGQVTGYIAWLDSKGSKGRTEGEPKNSHMRALFARARRENIRIRAERW